MLKVLIATALLVAALAPATVTAARAPAKTAPKAVAGIDIVLFNDIGSAVRLGGPRGVLVQSGHSASITEPATATDFGVYIQSERCTHVFAFSPRTSGYPWDQTKSVPFKVQIGKYLTLALLPEDASKVAHPLPPQPRGFPLFSPKVNCLP